MRMRVFFMSVLFIFFTTFSPLYSQDKVRIAVGQIVEHPALNLLRESLKKGLEEKGYKDGEILEWIYQNAQGNPAIAIQISRSLISKKPQVIVALSTPMAQAIAKATNEIPIVFGAVSDPVAAKLTTHKNVTGLTDYVPPQQLIKLVQDFIPHLKSLGLIFNSGEVNSVKQAQDIKELCTQKGIQVIEAMVSRSSEVPTATQSFVGRVDAILLPTDNTVISSLETILKVATQHKIPVFGSDVDIARRGAVAAYGVDWTESGFEIAQIVGDILKGVPVSDISIQSPHRFLFYINPIAAENMGVNVPDDILKNADFVL